MADLACEPNSTNLNLEPIKFKKGNINSYCLIYNINHKKQQQYFRHKCLLYSETYI